MTEASIGTDVGESGIDSAPTGREGGVEAPTVERNAAEETAEGGHLAATVESRAAEGTAEGGRLAAGAGSQLTARSASQWRGARKERSG